MPVPFGTIFPYWYLNKSFHSKGCFHKRNIKIVSEVISFCSPWPSASSKCSKEVSEEIFKYVSKACLEWVKTCPHTFCYTESVIINPLPGIAQAGGGLVSLFDFFFCFFVFWFSIRL